MRIFYAPWTVWAVSLLVAQTASAEALLPETAISVPQLAKSEIGFEAEKLTYSDNEAEVTATGNVSVVRDGNHLTADKVVYDRNTGVVTASGNVTITDAKGNVVTADKTALTESLHDGAVENILLILSDKSRLAARSGTRTDFQNKLDHAVYSPCDVCAHPGKERPVWRIKAVKVTLNEVKKRVYYDHAYLEFFNTPVVYLPKFSHPSPDVSRASGFLVPVIKQSQNLGFVAEIPYYINMAPWRDLTVSPTVFTLERPALSLEYRERFQQGPVRIGGTLTNVAELNTNSEETGRNIWRGYLYADGQLQHSTSWRSTFGIRATTDDTFLRRYEITNDDTLRSYYTLERFSRNSYFSAELNGFQSLRLNRTQGIVPLALPLLTYWWRSQPSYLGGRLTVTADTASIIRTKAADSQRASLTANYEIPYVNRIGMVWKLTGEVRGDVYYQTNSVQQDSGGTIYSGQNGFQKRFLPVAALQVNWPFIGHGLGGTQTLEPIVQAVASPTDNRFGQITNEDSRSIDLDETNLFSLNRFPGYDRSDGGVRFTYGLRWSLDRKNLNLTTEIGQSVRTNNASVLFPAGAGLSEEFSDIVGGITLKLNSKLSLISRFRLDQSSLAIRRNEFDVRYASGRLQLNIGYSNLSRGIAIEDVQDGKEIRGLAKLRITPHWSISGSTIYNLTSGTSPIRNSFGALYEDECFTFGLTWRRNYTSDRDFNRGSTYLFQFSLKNLGASNH